MNRIANPPSISLLTLTVAATAALSMFAVRPARADLAEDECTSMAQKASAIHRALLDVARGTFCKLQQGYTTISPGDCKGTSDQVEDYKRKAAAHLKTALPRGITPGPVSLEESQTGRVLGLTQRKYMSPLMYLDRAVISLKRLDGNAKATFVVCTFDGNKHQKIGGDSLDRKAPGETYRQELSGLTGKLVYGIVSARGTPLQSMKYQLTFAPTR
jgi:hypothetical protein